MTVFEEIAKTLSCCSICGTKKEEEENTVLSTNETVKIINIISKLQNTNNVKLVMPILNELEELIDVKGSALGIYNPESGEDEFLAASVPVESILKSHKHTYSKVTNHEVFFKNEGGEYCCFFYLKCRNNYLDNRQQEILTIVLPYLYSSIIRLNLISRQLSVFDLTSREHDVMQWIITGKDNWSISKILGVSERTVKFHNCNIYRKLGVSTKAEAISLYLRVISNDEQKLYAEI